MDAERAALLEALSAAKLALRAERAVANVARRRTADAEEAARSGGSPSTVVVSGLEGEGAPLDADEAGAGREALARAREDVAARAAEVGAEHEALVRAREEDEARRLRAAEEDERVGREREGRVAEEREEIRALREKAGEDLFVAEAKLSEAEGLAEAAEEERRRARAAEEEATGVEERAREAEGKAVEREGKARAAEVAAREAEMQARVEERRVREEGSVIVFGKEEDSGRDRLAAEVRRAVEKEAEAVVLKDELAEAAVREAALERRLREETGHVADGGEVVRAMLDEMAEVRGRLRNAKRERDSGVDRARELQRELEMSRADGDVGVVVERLKKRVAGLEDLLEAAEADDGEKHGGGSADVDVGGAEAEREAKEARVQNAKTAITGGLVEELREEAAMRGKEVFLLKAEVKTAGDTVASVRFERDEAMEEKVDALGRLALVEAELEDTKAAAKKTVDSSVGAGSRAKKMEQLMQQVDDSKRAHSVAVTAASEMEKEVKKAAESAALAEEGLAATQNLLAFARDEVSRLEAERKDWLIGSDTGGPVSVESAGVSLQRMQELEESASSAKANAVNKSSEVQKLQQALDKASAEVSVLRGTLASQRKELSTGHQSLREGAQQRNRLDLVIANLERELRSKEEEVATQSERINGDLMPALEVARDDVRRKAAEISRKSVQIAELRVTTDKTRQLLEQDVATTSARLESTRHALQSTQSRLAASETRCSELDATVLALVDDVRCRDSLIEELEDDLTHRKAALLSLQTLLAALENCVSAMDQRADDADEARSLAEAEVAALEDKITVANSRAARKDEELLYAEKLMVASDVSLSELKETLFEKQTAWALSEKVCDELREVIGVKESNFVEQAQLASRREANFDSLSAELRETVASRDGQINVLETEGSATQRQMALLNGKLVKTENELESTRESLAERSGQLALARTGVEEKGQELHRMHSEVSRLQSVLESKVADIAARDSRIETQLSSIAAQEGKMAGMRAEATALEESVENLHGSISALEEDREGNRSDIAALNVQVSALRQRVADDELAAQETSETAAELRSFVAEGRAQLQRASVELSDRVARLTDVEGTCRVQEETIKKSEKDMLLLKSHMEGHDTLMKEYQSSQQSLRANTEELEEALKDLAMLRDAHMTAKNEIEVTSAALAEAKARGTDLSATNTNLQVNIATLTVARDSAEKQAREGADALADLEKKTSEKIAASKSAIAKLRTTLADNSSENEKQVLALTNMRDRSVASLTKAQAELEMKTGAMIGVEKELGIAQNSFDEVTQMLEDLKLQLSSEKEVAEVNLAAAVTAASAAGAARGAAAKDTAAACNAESSEAVKEMKGKLAAKERAVANLHEWCSFINGRLEVSEKKQAELEAELAISTKAFERVISGTTSTALSTDERATASRSVSAGGLRSVPSGGETSGMSGKSYLLANLRENETALSDAKGIAVMWKKKYNDIEPKVEAGVEAQRQAGALQSKLAMTEKESANHIDFLTQELEVCKADRDIAERDCAAAIGDNAAMRTRLASELQKGSGSASSLTSLRSGESRVDSSHCRAHFSLEGAYFPGKDFSMSVVGSDLMLGGWKLANRLPMMPTRTSSTQTIWKAQAVISTGSPLEYKFVAESFDGQVKWEDGANRSIDLTGVGAVTHLHGHWRGP